jgi:hypothetical protein
MAEAGVADFHGGFGHVVPSGTEQFGGAFHAGLAQELGDGHAHLAGEGAAEVKGAAANLTSQFLEVGRFGQVRAQDLADLVDAFTSDAFLPFTEEFAGGFEEDLGR